MKFMPRREVIIGFVVSFKWLKELKISSDVYTYLFNLHFLSL